jgi:hypothetical protein
MLLTINNWFVQALMSRLESHWDSFAGSNIYITPPGAQVQVPRTFPSYIPPLAYITRAKYTKAMTPK